MNNELTFKYGLSDSNYVKEDWSTMASVVGEQSQHNSSSESRIEI